MTFDPLGPAEASAQLTLSLLLNGERASRLATQKVYDASLPSLTEVLGKMTQTLWKNGGLSAADYKGQIRRITAVMYLTELMNLSLSKSASIDAKVAASAAVAEIKALTKTGAGWNTWVQELIRNFEANPKEFEAASFHIAPDGQPIDQDYDWLGIDCEHEH